MKKDAYSMKNPTKSAPYSGNSSFLGVLEDNTNKTQESGGLNTAKN